MKLYGADYTPQLYTLAGDEKLSINTFPYSNDEVLVTLGVDYTANGNCTLSFEDLETFSSTISIQLQDLVTGDMINLRQNPSYTFDYNTSNDPERFVLHFNGVSSTEEDQPEWAHIYKSGDKLVVDMFHYNEQPGTLQIINASGQNLFSSEVSQQGQQAFDFSYPRGLYLVKLTMNDEVIVKKIIQ